MSVTSTILSNNTRSWVSDILIPLEVMSEELTRLSKKLLRLTQWLLLFSGKCKVLPVPEEI